MKRATGINFLETQRWDLEWADGPEAVKHAEPQPATAVAALLLTEMQDALPETSGAHRLALSCHRAR